MIETVLLPKVVSNSSRIAYLHTLKRGYYHHLYEATSSRHDRNSYHSKPLLGFYEGFSFFVRYCW